MSAITHHSVKSVVRSVFCDVHGWENVHIRRLAEVPIANRHVSTTQRNFSLTNRDRNHRNRQDKQGIIRSPSTSNKNCEASHSLPKNPSDAVTVTNESIKHSKYVTKENTEQRQMPTKAPLSPNVTSLPSSQSSHSSQSLLPTQPIRSAYPSSSSHQPSESPSTPRSGTNSAETCFGERPAQSHAPHQDKIFTQNSTQNPLQNHTRIHEQQTPNERISDPTPATPTLPVRSLKFPSFLDQLQNGNGFSLPFLQQIQGFSRCLPNAVLEAIEKPKSRAKVIYKGGTRVKPEKTTAGFHVVPSHSGQGLEDAIAIMLRAEGFKDVYQSVMCLDRFNNYSELDVVATKRSWWRRLSPPRKGSPIRWLQGWVAVECKQYSEAVKFEYVAKTAGVAHLLQIHPSDMLFITTSTYTPRCVAAGLPLVDGAQLHEWIYSSHLSRKAKKEVQNLLSRADADAPTPLGSNYHNFSGNGKQTRPPRRLGNLLLAWFSSSRDFFRIIFRLLFTAFVISEIAFHDDPLETRYLSKTLLPSFLPSTFDPFSLSYITKGFSGPALPPQSSWFSTSPLSFVSVRVSAENVEDALEKPVRHRALALTLASEAHFTGHEAAWQLLWNTISSSWERNQIPPPKLVAGELYDCIRRAVYLPFVFIRSLVSMGATASLSHKSETREIREISQNELASLFAFLNPMLSGPTRVLSDLFFRISEADRDCWGVGCTCKIRGQCSFTRITSNDTISSRTAFAAEDAMQEAADSILSEGRVQKARPVVLLYSHPFENGSDTDGLFFVSLQPSANALSFESPQSFLSTQSTSLDLLRENNRRGENILMDKTAEIEAKKALRRTFYSLLREHYLSFDWLSVAQTKRPLKTTAKKPVPLYSYVEEVCQAGSPQQPQQPQQQNTNIFRKIFDNTMSTVRGEEVEEITPPPRRHSLSLFNGDIYAERYFTDFEQAPWVLPHEWLSATHRRHLNVISVPVPSIFTTKGKIGSLIKSAASYISWELSNAFK